MDHDHAGYGGPLDDRSGPAAGGSHAHSHHHHGAAPRDFGNVFLAGIGLNLGFVIAEAIFGVRSHSIALLADAGHNLSDVLGLAFAWAASLLVRRPTTSRHTYGYRRSSVLAAIGNAVLLLTTTGAIAWEGIQRLMHPAAVGTGTVMAVAAAGIGINLTTALLFRGDRHRDLNVRAAYAHMLGDAAVAAGVVVAGLSIRVTGALWIDPVVSLLIAALVVMATWRLLRESVNLALDAVPEHIDQAAVRRYLADIEGVTEVHDLHIWGMSTTEVALTAHLVRPSGLATDAMLGSVCHELKDRFAIDHATLQIELGDAAHPCHLAPETVV
jgi:cobalt-zinc-cadmium efflux system protein